MSDTSDIPSLISLEDSLPSLESIPWSILIENGKLKLKMFYLDFLGNGFENDELCSLVYFTHDEMTKKGTSKDAILSYYGATLTDDMNSRLFYNHN